MTRYRRIATAVALAAFATGTALAQDDAKKKKDKPWKGGRVPVKREQGSAKDLKAKFESLIRTLKQRATKKAAAKPPASKPVKKTGGGITPPKKGDPASKPAAPDKAEQELLKTLRAFAPDKKALIDVLTPEGVKTIGRPLYKASRKLFGEDVDGICQRLKLDPKLEKIAVFQASTEDLASMEMGTLAAKEFASGLRRSARLLRGQYQWYCVLLKRPKAKADDRGVRLQLFVYSQKRYVYLGKIWRLDK